MKKFFVALLMAVSSLVAAQTATVPAAAIQTIATNKATNYSAVYSWLNANNGDALYATYQSLFVTPAPSAVWKLTTIQPVKLPGTTRISYPYPIERVAGFTADCTAFNTTPTDLISGSLCVLGYWNQYMVQKAANDPGLNATVSAMTAVLNSLQPYASATTVYDARTSGLLASVFARAKTYDVNNLSWSNAQVNSSTKLGKYTSGTNPGWNQYSFEAAILIARYDTSVMWRTPTVFPANYTPCAQSGLTAWNPDDVIFVCSVYRIPQLRAEYDMVNNSWGYFWTTYPTLRQYVGEPHRRYATNQDMAWNIVAMQAVVNVTFTTLNSNTLFTQARADLQAVINNWPAYQQTDTMFIQQMSEQYPNAPVIDTYGSGITN